MNLAIREKAGGITIECRVTPRSGKTGLKGVRDGILCIALSAPPVEGRANEALIEYLAKTLVLPLSNISILRGDRGRNKLLFIRGVSTTEFYKRFSISKS